jgi:hypothetical protein
MLTYLSTFLFSHSSFTHVILLGGSIIAEFAVAIGIILESPKEKTFRERLGMVLVLGGVSIGAILTISLFVFDEGISRGQQDKIILLETRIAPREINDDEAKIISASLKGFPGTRFDLSMQTEIEPMRLTDRIEDILIASGWVEQPDRSPSSKFNRMNRSLVGIRTVAGVWVTYPADDQNLTKAGGMLVWALRDVGMVVQEVRETKPDQFDVGVVHVWIGGKP